MEESRDAAKSVALLRDQPGAQGHGGQVLYKEGGEEQAPTEAKDEEGWVRGDFSGSHCRGGRWLEGNNACHVAVKSVKR